MSDGVGEIELASILDVYPRSFSAVTYTFSNERNIIKSKNGLDFIPRYDFKTIGYLDRLLVLGDGLKQKEINFFNKYYSTLEIESPEDLGGNENKFAYDKVLLDLSVKENKAITKSVSKTLDYPIGHLNLVGKGWPFSLLLGPIIFGLIGVTFANWFEKRYLR